MRAASASGAGITLVALGGAASRFEIQPPQRRRGSADEVLGGSGRFWARLRVHCHPGCWLLLVVVVLVLVLRLVLFMMVMFGTVWVAYASCNLQQENNKCNHLMFHNKLFSLRRMVNTLQSKTTV